MRWTFGVVGAAGFGQIASNVEKKYGIHRREYPQCNKHPLAPGTTRERINHAPVEDFKKKPSSRHEPNGILESHRQHH
jgi:hypothetical protein